MKREKVFHCRLSKTGRTYPVTLKFLQYNDNKTLAVKLVSAIPPWSPFATISVNLGGGRQDDTHAYLDTNNCPWAVEFLQDNEIAKPVEGAIGVSGFCTYPLYEFNLESKWEDKK